MAYFCQCGAKLNNVGVQGKTGTTKRISYKVLHVETVRYYKCPNGCELKTVSQT
jgi:hypothetical protein